MQRIDSIDDPRIAAYRNLRDRTARGENLFVAEGRLLALRLLESDYAVESLLVSERFAEEFDALVGDRAPLYAANPELIRKIVGFKFHRGVLAVGRIRRPGTVDELLAGANPASAMRLIVCPAVTQPENLGLVFRTAAGFGIDGIVLGPGCCQPFSRRCLRLSMGSVLRVRLAVAEDVAAGLQTLRDRWNVTPVATVLDERAEPLARFRWPRRTALLLGNEYAGLDQRLLALCDRQVTIPMRPDTDSLNLGVAAGIFVYEMTKTS